jgi:inner membrane protein
MGLGRRAISRRLLVAGVVLSVVPDLDVLAFRFGVPYSAELGHRGFSHSLLVAGFCALLVAWALRKYREGFGRSFVFLFVAMASHGILDAFTNGGLGVEFFWPFSAERFFAPVRVIAVSPLGVSRIWSQHGLSVLVSELLWVWLPCAVICAGLVYYRYKIQNRKTASAPIADIES